MVEARVERLFRPVTVLLFALSLVLLPGRAAYAQSGPIDAQLLGVDVGRFPRVCLRAAPLDANGAALVDLPQDAVTVYENGEGRPVEALTKEYVGSAVAVIFDASGSFALRGSQPNARRFDDAIAALDELVLQKGKWLQSDSKVDQLMLIAPTSRDTYQVAATWTNEPVVIHNSAYPLPVVKSDTPLYKMLIEAMVRMKDLPDWERRAKFLLVFSDGVDRTSPNDITDVINRANDLGVKVLAVKIGPDPAGKSLQRMARETPRGDSVADWSYVEYKDAASLAPLYGSIKSRGEQLKVCYRSKINQAGSQSVEFGVKVAGREYRSPALSFSLAVKPPSVRIAEPADGVVFNRIASDWQQDPKAIEPFEIPVTVEVAWPDGYPRSLNRVFYEVDGSVIASLGADEAFVWNFAELPAGSHSLVVKVRDELGMVGVSEPARAQINLTIPPAPTATPAPLPTVAPQASFLGVKALDDALRPLVENPVLLAVLLLAILAAGLAVYALVRLARSPQRVEQITQTMTAAVDSATQIIRPRRAGPAATRAELVPLIDDTGKRGDPIPIRWQNTAIGRDPQRAQIVFSDMGVSRLHARIVEEADHVFVLHDEGSSSGTYVGEEQISVAKPRALRSGDIVEFGPVRAVFQLLNNPAASPRPSAAGADMTEPVASPGRGRSA